MRQPERIIRRKTVEACTGLSRSTIYRKMRDGTFRSVPGSAATVQAGTSPTSSAGSPIRSHGRHEFTASSTSRIDDEGGDTPPRSRRIRPPAASEQLEALLDYPVTMGRLPNYDMAPWTVTDDWPDSVPVTMAEIDVFERWFDELSWPEA